LEEQLQTRRVDSLIGKIPAKLADIRGEHRSQRSFARELGVYQQNVNRWEAGTKPELDFCVRLAVDEGVDLNWLIAGIGKKYRG